MATYKKNLFTHGGSKAIDLPKEAFVDKLEKDEVTIEITEEGLFIPFDHLTNMESDPQFQLFIEAIYQNAMKNPDQLKNLEEVWDKDWEDLLEGVEANDDE